ncbi:hypothetical protein GCM10022280_23140 [Sphingomonas swuensis]|uniref:Uncharacterized protein n=1 Tax=Sphingomonas swuensis TaxID=977800 RepID=A0ABP7T762_9SPHN
MAGAKARDQGGERDLGGISRAAEHAFTEEGAAERHPVEPADQGLVLPDLDRVAEALVEQVEHGALDRAVDPRLLAVGAAGDDIGEGGVDADPEATRAEALGKASAEPEAVEGKDRAMPRLDPEEVVGVTRVAHREHARGIAVKHHRRVERAAHGGGLTHGCGMR